MQTVLKWLLRLVSAAALGLVVLAALAWYLVSGSLPDHDGEVRVAGLSAPVEIVRDANAVPHIRAESELDAYAALGLVHAQDRLWQMELNRRAAQGRLSALFGGRTIEADRLMKTLDLYGHAERSLPAQSERTREILEAYAEGVNAWIRHVNTHALGRGAPEFFVFEGTLSPWTAADSLAILKLMALRLSNAARQEVRRAQIVLHLPPERVLDILPEYPVPALIAPRRPADAAPGGFRAAAEPLRELGLPVGAAPEAMLEDPLLAALTGAVPPELAGASNAWAVDGTRTASGVPLLANDPHLWLSAPSVWYLAHLEGGGLGAIGGTLPGVPAVLIGRNRALGWGLTTTHADDQDLYIERLNPDNPEQYATPEGWQDFRTRTIRIEVAGQQPISETVRATRHGPVLSGNQFGTDAIKPEGHAVALAWTALSDDDPTMTAALELMRATNVDDAIEIAAKAVAPAQNLTLADEESIALTVAGRLPRRREDSLSQGRLPSLGSNPRNDWIGWLDTADKPRVVRPSSGAVANANNRITDRPYPYHLSHDWPLPYRIQRLEKELSARAFHSRDTFVALQNDAVSEMARAVLPLIARDLWWREGTPVIADARRRRALEMLAGWNGAMDKHGPEALIFSEWMRALTRRLAADELGPLFPMMDGIRPLFVERVFRDIDGAGIWCDIDKTPERESCRQMADQALNDALARLARDHGSNIEGWRWGEAHVAVHRHLAFGREGLLGLIFNIEHETSGGGETLLRGQMPGTGPEPFANVHAAGLRVVYDFADLDRSQMIISTGQSGHPFSRFYDHLGELWARGDMIPMSMEADDARAGALGTMLLTPGLPE